MQLLLAFRWHLIFFLYVLCNYPAAEAENCDDSVILQIVVEDSLTTTRQQQYFNAGINCALDQQLPTMGRATIRYDGSRDTATFIESAIFSATANNKPPLTITGIMDHVMLKQVQSGTAQTQRITNIGSYFKGDIPRHWNDLTYLTRSSELLEAMMAIRYAIIVLRTKRIAFSTADAVWAGPQQLRYLTNFVKAVGYQKGVDYVLYDGKFSSFQAGMPQAQLLFDFAVTFPPLYLKSTLFINLVTLSSSYNYGKLQAYYSTAELPTGFSQRLFMTNTNHIAKDLNHAYIQNHFLSNWKACYSSTTHTIQDNDPYAQIYSVAGWIVGSMTARAVQGLVSTGAACSSTHLQQYLLGPGVSASWTIGEDFRVATFSGMCDTEQSSTTQRSGCQCNQGGRSVWLYEIALGSRAGAAPSNIESMNYSLSVSEASCYFAEQDIPVPLLLSLLTCPTCSGTGVTLDYAQRVVEAVGVVQQSRQRSSIEIKLNEIQLTSPTDAASVRAYLSSRRLGVAVTGVGSDALPLENTLKLSLLQYSLTNLANAPYREDAVTVYPNLGPSIYNALAIPIQETAPPGAAYYYCSPTAFQLADDGGYVSPARRYWKCPLSFYTFRPSEGAADLDDAIYDLEAVAGNSTDTEASLRATAPPRRRKPSLGLQHGKLTVVYGSFKAYRPAPVADFLAANTNSHVAMLFPDFMLVYDDFLTYFQKTKVTRDVQRLPRVVEHPATTTTSTPIMNSANWMALLVLIALLCLTLLLLAFLYFHKYCQGHWGAKINKRMSATCIVFSFGEVVARSSEAQDADATARLRGDLEKVVRDALRRFHIKELSNTGCEVTAMTNDVFAAIQCCRTVEEEALNMPPIVSLSPSDLRWAAHICTGVSTGLGALGPFRRTLTDIPSLHGRMSLTGDREVYRVGERSTRASGTNLVGNPFRGLRRCLSRVPEADRVPLLLALCGSWRFYPPFRGALQSDAAYGDVLLFTLLDEVAHSQVPCEEASCTSLPGNIIRDAFGAHPQAVPEREYNSNRMYLGVYPGLTVLGILGPIMDLSIDLSHLSLSFDICKEASCLETQRK
eukprot:gene2591-1610_t